MAPQASEKRASIGFDRRLKLNWLNHALLLAGQELPSREAIQHLKESLGSELEGREAQRKTLIILSHIWLTPPEDLVALRDSGVELCSGLGIGKAGLALHWGMSMAVYPFFGRIAETVGRLLRLQDSLTLPQIQRRIAERVGDRSTAVRAGQRVVRTMIDWGVLRDTSKTGSYHLEKCSAIEDKFLALWLVEASLWASGKNQANLETVVRNPSLFPFDITCLGPGDIEANPRLEIVRHGLDQDFVSLRGPLKAPLGS